MCAFIDWTILADSGKGICHIEKCRSSNLWIFHLQLNCCYNSTITKQNDCVCVWCYCTDLNIMRKSLHSGLCHMAHHCQWTLSVIILTLFCWPTLSADNDGTWGMGADTWLTLSADIIHRYFDIIFCWPTCRPVCQGGQQWRAMWCGPHGGWFWKLCSRLWWSGLLTKLHITKTVEHSHRSALLKTGTTIFHVFNGPPQPFSVFHCRILLVL